jgi:hypothetical protein
LIAAVNDSVVRVEVFSIRISSPRRVAASAYFAGSRFVSRPSSTSSAIVSPSSSRSVRTCFT